MDLNGQLVLGCLEEDNPQRGHFRIRPLLLSTGPVSPQDQASYRDEGYIRVVPDKNEQHTFKERMRRLGSLCVMDLRGSTKENGKLRPNNKYAPAKGEKNRFIIYSNAVSEIPEGAFFEVVADTKLQEAATAQVYARRGGRIHGPVSRDTGEELPEARRLLPDDARLFSISMPDGGTRLFYWPQTEPAQEAPAPVQPEQPEAEKAAEPPEIKPEEMELAISEPKSALDLIRELNGRMVASMKGEDGEPKEKPEAVVISQVGTPLYHAVLPPAGDSGANRSLAQAVAKSRRAQKAQETDDRPEETKKTGEQAGTAEEKAGKPAKAGKADKAEKGSKADKPAAKSAAKGKASKKTEERVDPMPVPAPSAAPAAVPALSALQAQVQDLEAERLMCVMNLEKARADEEQYAREVLLKTEASWKDAESAAQERLEGLKNQIAALEKERDELEKAAASLNGADGVRTVPAGEVHAQTVRDRLCTALREQGLRYDAALADAMLTAWAAADRKWLCVAGETPADRVAAQEAFARALGAPALPLYEYSGCGGCGESAMVILEAPEPVYLGNETVFLCDTQTAEGFFAPVIPVEQSGEEPADELTVFTPVREKTLREEILARKTELNAETSALIAQIRAICREEGETLSVPCVRALKRFLTAAQNRMAGGVRSALDWGLTIYVLPQVLKPGTLEKLKPLFALLPETTRMLERKQHDAAADIEHP